MNRKMFVVIQVVLLALLGSVVGTAAGRLSSPSEPAQQPTGLSASPLTPVGSGFTYQGRLLDGGGPANGQYDFQIIMYDALVGGNQVGPVVTATNQLVSDGLITLTLDFGAGAYDGNGRWLEVQVRPAGGGSYTILSPRQPLTPAPYAMHAKDAETVPDGSITTAKIADGGVTAGKIAPGADETVYTLTLASNVGTTDTTEADFGTISLTVASNLWVVGWWGLQNNSSTYGMRALLSMDGIGHTLYGDMSSINQQGIAWSTSKMYYIPDVAPGNHTFHVAIGGAPFRIGDQIYILADSLMWIRAVPVRN